MGAGRVATGTAPDVNAAEDEPHHDHLTRLVVEARLQPARCMHALKDRMLVGPAETSSIATFFDATEERTTARTY
jgi:hypothetical protein